MGQIYSEAQNVVAWIGMKSRHSDLAATLVQDIALKINVIPSSYYISGTSEPETSPTDDVFLTSLAKQICPEKAVDGLVELMSWPYWERV